MDIHLTRNYDEDYTAFFCVVNKHWDDFKLSEFSANKFKWLIFVRGLVSKKNARVLDKLENESNLTLQKSSKTANVL